MQKIKWEKLPKKESLHILSKINFWSQSPDPFLSVTYDLDINSTLDFLNNYRKQKAEKVTITHLLNKVFAIAFKENPLFNSVILRNRVYLLGDVHLVNAVLVDKTDITSALKTFIIQNPQNMLLEEISDYFEKEKERLKNDYSVKKSYREYISSKILMKYRLNKLMGEKKFFQMLLKKSLFSNILITNTSFGGESKFRITKTPIYFAKFVLRIHVHSIQTTMLENKILKKLPILVTVDHRLVDAFHLHSFGETLQKILNNPEEYLVGD